MDLASEEPLQKTERRKGADSAISALEWLPQDDWLPPLNISSIITKLF